MFQICKLMYVATVVEGDTDHLVIEALILHLYPGAFVTRLHPSDPYDEFGTGWKGVKEWCKHHNTQLSTLLAGDTGPKIDLLVVHVDADIAHEVDLQEGSVSPVPDVKRPCPPIDQTANKLMEVLSDWFGVTNLNHLPSEVVFAVPSQDLESWIFASLFPDDPLCSQLDFECIQTKQSQHPTFLLSTKKYKLAGQAQTLVKRKKGQLKKRKILYTSYLSNIVSGWDNTVRICTQAAAFQAQLP